MQRYVRLLIRIFSEAFERFLLENPAEAKAIVEKATTLQGQELLPNGLVN